MVGNALSPVLRAQVRVACGRVVGVTAAILEAHRLGVAEGSHECPWTLDYQREASPIFGLLPAWYESRVAALFGRCAETMDGCSIPAWLAQDWVIVAESMVTARRSILERLESASGDPDLRPRTPSSSESIEELERPPFVLRFDALARLTTRAGAMRLQQAATAVRQYMEAPSPEFLDDREHELLRRLANGEAIADLAAEMGYSERSIYRALAGLWEKLGVPGRKEGIQKAALEGLLNTGTPLRVLPSLQQSSIRY